MGIGWREPLSNLDNEFILDASAAPMANQLLAALPAAAYRRLLPHLEATTLSLDQPLLALPGPSQFAYFPTESIITLSYAVAPRSCVHLCARFDWASSGGASQTICVDVALPCRRTFCGENRCTASNSGEMRSMPSWTARMAAALRRWMMR
jgi:hypothetical protein